MCVCVCCLHFFVQLLPQLCNNLISMSWIRQSAYRWQGSPPASAFCSWHADRKPFSSALAYISVERCWYRWKSLKSQLKDKKKAGLLGFETLPAGFTIILHLGWLIFLTCMTWNMDVQHCPIGPDCWVPMPAPPVIRGKTNESIMQQTHVKIDTQSRIQRSRSSPRFPPLPVKENYKSTKRESKERVKTKRPGCPHLRLLLGPFAPQKIFSFHHFSSMSMTDTNYTPPLEPWFRPSAPAPFWLLQLSRMVGPSTTTPFASLDWHLWSQDL